MVISRYGVLAISTPHPTPSRAPKGQNAVYMLLPVILTDSTSETWFELTRGAMVTEDIKSLAGFTLEHSR